ncbi:MAG: hypothetical protein AB1405_07810 [Bdellovibrionota bacterium]
MGTLGQLKSAIATELAEGWISSDARIADAINQAIADYQDEPFYFVEEIDTAAFTTVANQQAYALPADFLKPDLVQITVSGRKYTIRPIPYAELQDLDAASNSVSSYPDRYAIYGQQIYLYPRPNGAYTGTIHHRYKLGAPLADGNTNAWTDDAEELIRQAVKAKICANHLERDEDAVKYGQLAEMQRERLLRKTRRMVGSSRVARASL